MVHWLLHIDYASFLRDHMLCIKKVIIFFQRIKIPIKLYKPPKRRWTKKNCIIERENNFKCGYHQCLKREPILLWFIYLSYV